MRAPDQTPDKQPALPPELAEKHQQILDRLTGLNGALVAFSGGVDSSLVAYLAHQCLGEKALAVTSASDSLSRADLTLTRNLAAEWGMAHRVIETEELNNPHYLANPVDRCYHCKSTLYTDLAKLARETGYEAILNGTNTDDLGDHRPGLRAADEHRVIAPLAEAGLNKADIRLLAGFLGLPNHDKPQAACLSSRVPYGLVISKQVLTQVEQAESFLKALGFGQLRVRHHDTLARIEVPVADFDKVMAHREAIESGLRKAGYRYVTLDLRGFRSGSLNEGL